MTGVLEFTSRGRHAAPDAEVGPFGLILGERPLPSVVELQFIDRAVHAPSSGFSYGQAYDAWEGPVTLRGRERYEYGTIGARRMNAFYTEANKLACELSQPIWNERAAIAGTAILDVVDSPDDTEALALQVPFDEWDGDQYALPRFAGWVRQMVDAYDDPDGDQIHLIRDDSNDKNVDQFGKHVTKMWLGSGRVRGLFVIEEPAIRYDEYGNRSLMMEIWVAKRQNPKEALRLGNRHDLIARERISRLLDEHPQPATPEEKTYILWYADRASIQNDADVPAWLEWYRSPSLGRWERARRAAGAIIDRLAERQAIRWIERTARSGKGKHNR